MRRSVAALTACLIVFSSGGIFAGTAEPVGFRQVELPDANGKRSINLALWYPTTDKATPVSVGENQAFIGIEAVKSAAPDGKTHPLVVLSHGYGGSWRNLNWLAGELVGQGYIVAAPDHPGTTTFNRDKEQAAQLWERPHDLSRVIDAVATDSALAGKVEPSRIAAIGHSLGGWSVVALAGAQFDPARFDRDCTEQPNPRTCGLASELITPQGNVAAEKLKTMKADPRVGAIVSLDLGLARGFTPESLNSITVPAMIFGAGVDIGDLPAKLESGYVASNMPSKTAQYVEIADAMHFSFMQICKAGAAELIEAETPGDGIVCKDGGERSREAIHREVADMIIAFLAKSLPAK
ncbi:alpha/beta fold hydrolase [Pseudochrobactrum sp. sp1633]|uniref:alpha/beta hydrolase family protein n=1 Tax=Pseudochrobactrum sp. sp1633 TaxID=3036706 RepID=UPI0025A59F04|nr:alpha/beta fold hydrolase [Pseudochrobactrum sp. sp1633]MDM8344804.1 alpha/beta fold hydrolase [Pseudochrobactrum sp. sp1633]HWD13435.1 alpha/beta fold hydrolase [Pseudochrobactrum sp.]